MTPDDGQPPSFWHRIHLLVVIWALALMATFLASLLWAGLGDGAWPDGLEPPFSSVHDAVLASDGSSWVYIGQFDRIGHYDAEGRFLGSIAGRRGRGLKILSATTDGRLYVLHGRTVCRAHPPPPEGRGCVRRPAGSSGRWILEREPVWHPAGGDEDPGVSGRGPAAGAPVARSLVAPGDPLVADAGIPARGPKGDRLSVHGGSLVRRATPEGVRWRTGPWYLLWMQLPFPGLLGVLAAVVLSAQRNSVRRRIETPRGAG